MRVLYIEDEKMLADAVIYLMKKSDINVDWADNGEDGLSLAQKPIYDAIVLDLILPKISGLEILKIIRSKKINTPIIILSALSEVENKIEGLNLGADDYLAKPFKTSELIARLNAITRRPRNLKPNILKYSDLELNYQERTLNGSIISEKETEILEMLMKTPGRTIKKEIILAHVWGNSKTNEENYVEVYISYLRTKLKKINSNAEIKTIRNLGYKITEKNVQ